VKGLNMINKLNIIKTVVIFCVVCVVFHNFYGTNDIKLNNELTSAQRVKYTNNLTQFKNDINNEFWINNNDYLKNENIAKIRYYSTRDGKILKQNLIRWIVTLRPEHAVLFLQNLSSLPSVPHGNYEWLDESSYKKMQKPSKLFVSVVNKVFNHNENKKLVQFSISGNDLTIDCTTAVNCFLKEGNKINKYSVSFKNKREADFIGLIESIANNQSNVLNYQLTFSIDDNYSEFGEKIVSSNFLWGETKFLSKCFLKLGDSLLPALEYETLVSPDAAPRSKDGKTCYIYQKSFFVPFVGIILKWYSTPSKYDVLNNRLEKYKYSPLNISSTGKNYVSCIESLLVPAHKICIGYNIPIKWDDWLVVKRNADK
jgi:hypothetical protein